MLLCTVAVSVTLSLSNANKLKKKNTKTKQIHKIYSTFNWILINSSKKSPLCMAITAFNGDSQITMSNANELNTQTSCVETDTDTENNGIMVAKDSNPIQDNMNKKDTNSNSDNNSETTPINGQIKDTQCAMPTKISTKTVKNKSSDTKKDIYMVAEGYHKTDSCYYKTPDGGYHKLPPDSYHKMSEICYNKLPDGSFKRLVDIQNAISGEVSGSSDATNAVGSQSKVRNNMIKFLKRSKSHSQATAKDTYINYRKDIQRAKVDDKLKDNQYNSIIKNSNSSNIAPQNTSQPGQNAVGIKSTASHNSNQRHSNHAGNRKVVVTMMENGGLPIVATSKSKTSKSDHKSHHQMHHSIRDKVKYDDDSYI